MRIFNYLFENKNFLKRRSVVLLLTSSCIIHLLLMFQDVNLLFSEMYDETTSSFSYDFFNMIIPTLVDVKDMLQYLGIPIHLTTPILASLYLTCLFFIVFDFKPILASAASIFIYAIFVYSALLHSFGVDSYIGIALFVTFLILVSRWSPAKILYPYTIRFIQIQLCIIYFFAGFGKILGTTWLDGNAMWLISNIYIGGPESPLAALMLNAPFLPVLLSWGIVLIELFYPLLIHNKYTRVITLTAVIMMHIGIILIMKLYSFGIVMIALNLAGYGHYYKPILEKLKFLRNFRTPILPTST